MSVNRQADTTMYAPVDTADEEASKGGSGGGGGGGMGGPVAAPPRKGKDRSQLISALSNVSIQYNFQSLICALMIMENMPEDGSPSAYKQSDSVESVLKSLVFAGAITGQLTMGYAGDAWGRKNAMILTNALTFVGALGTAIFTWGDDMTVYNIMMVCRFILGIGVGGKYPLAATMTSEGADAKKGKAHTATEVAKGFFWQTPGGMLPYAMGLLILYCTGSDKTGLANKSLVSMQFRIIVGLGAVPAFAVMVLTAMQPENERFVRAHKRSPNPFVVAKQHPEYWRKLLGTGMCWFLYDFVYYGMTCYQPTIIRKVFGQNEPLMPQLGQNIAVTAMGIPGVIAAIAMLGCIGSKRLQVRTTRCTLK